MSKYTTELRNVIRTYGIDTVKSWFSSYKLTDYLTDEEIDVIEERGTWSKERLAEKIINRYFMREIGQETPTLFSFYAKNEMETIMEEYLPLIYSASIKYDPLVNVDYTETFNRTNNNTTNTSGLDVNSDTPQGEISKENILAGTYASNTSANENSGSSNDRENYTRNIKGNSGVTASAQAMVKQYRENIRAIDKEIIDRLNVLFMGIY